MRTGRTLLTALFAVMLAFVFLAQPKGASGSEADLSLTVEFKVSETEIPGAVFDIYKIGVFVTDTYYELTGAFKDAFSIEELTDDYEGWDALAAEMSAFADGNGVAPTASSETNEYGLAVFEDLSAGLYLVVGRDAEYNGIRYCSLPFIVSVPARDAATGSFINNVTARPKPGVEEPIPTEAPTPEPTAEPTPEPTGEPTPEPTPTAEPTGEPTPEPTAEPTEEPTPTPEPIPQTGMLWWPVFVFAAAGVILVAIGAAVRASARKNEE